MSISLSKASTPDQRSVARMLAVALFGLCLTCLGGGCSFMQGVNDYLAYNDTTNDFVMGWRNSAWAHRSWHQRKNMYVGEPQFEAFGEGYRDGYVAGAGGGNGCPPPLPPRKFWSWKYQTCEGQAKVAAWYAGYPHGAAAAAEEGAGNWQEIQVSPSIEAQYSTEFRYPIIPGFEDYYQRRGPDGTPYGPPGGVLPLGTPAENLPPGQLIPPESRINQNSSAFPATTYQNQPLVRHDQTFPSPGDHVGYLVPQGVNFVSVVPR